MRSTHRLVVAVMQAGALTCILSSPVRGQIVWQSVVGAVFDRPVFVTAPPGDSQRLFVLEQHTGLVRIIKNGSVLPQPFILAPVGTFDVQQGLLGMAFHPNYAVNRRFFLSLTNTNGDLQILEGEALIGDPDKAMLTRPILEVDIPGGLAIGGWLGFRPMFDPYLYIAVGDGMGGPNIDPANTGQTIEFNLLANILRIDVDNAPPYAIPPANPFVPYPQTLDEIWVFGLRNPWRCSFDRATSDLWIGDTGYNNAEEVNFQPAFSHGGENYGWACYDGPAPTGRPCHPWFNQVTQPLHTYDHTGNRCAIVGGYVYRGCSFADFPFYGCYIFGDYCAGNVYTRNPISGQVTDLTPPLGFGLTSFGEDADGELYACIQGPPGDVRRLVFQNGFPPGSDCNTNGLLDDCDISSGRSFDTNANSVPDECECPMITQHPTNQIAVAGSSASFSVTAAGPGLAYQWRRDGTNVTDGAGFSGANTATLTINPAGPGLASNYDCVVFNSCGSATSNPARLYLTCPFAPTGDVSGDGAVNGLDIQPFTEAVRAYSTSMALICRADFSANGIIDEADTPGFVVLLLGL